jgi:hypothetical protein
MFGGTGVQPFADLWRYDPGSNQWYQQAITSATRPPPLVDAVMWCGRDDVLWLWGGVSSQADFWTFDPGTQQWQMQTLTGQKPPPRSAAARWQDAGGRFWLFGGRAKAALDDMWCFDPQTRQWTAIMPTPKPAPRSQAACWTARDGSMWLFGGQGARSLLNDLWKWDGLSGKWMLVATTNTPGPRAGALAWQHSDGSFMLGFGSGDDVWSLAPNATTWSLLKGRVKPGGKPFHGVRNADDVRKTPGQRGGIVGLHGGATAGRIFGGGLGSSVWSDTWELALDLAPVVVLRLPFNITATSADLQWTVHDNGVPIRQVTARYWPTGDEDSVQTTTSTQLVGLTAATSYEVEVTALTDVGDFVSQRRRFLTTGSSSLQPNWAQGNPTEATEGQPQKLTLTLDLGAPADSAVMLTLDYSGSVVTAPADLVELPTSLAVAPGQRFAELALQLVNDSVVESAELLRVRVNGGAVYEVSILDNDGPAHVDVSPASRLIAAGASTILQVQASGTPPLRYQWKRDGVNIRGASKPSQSVNKAGSYTVEVVAAVGGAALSSAAEVGFVTVRDEQRTLPTGAGTTLQVAATGTGLTYEWEKNGVSVGVSGAQWVLQNLTSADAGEYRCRITPMSGNSLLSGRITLQVVGGVPVIAADALPDGHVGSYYDHQVQITNLPAGPPSAISATGLPPGLRCSAMGRITGFPSAAAPSAKAVTLHARNLAGSATPVSTTVLIRAVPTSLLGRYVGLVTPSNAQAAGLGGMLDLTTSPKGSFTARLLFGVQSGTAKGQMAVTSGGAMVSFAVGGSVVSVQLTATALSGLVGGVNVTGYKQAASVASGVYHFHSLAEASNRGDMDLPQGTGWGRISASAGGAAWVSGVAADGSAFTCSTISSSGGEMPVFASSIGSLHGNLQLTSDFVDGLLRWTRLPATSTRVYRSGFDPQVLTVRGGRYVPVQPGQVILGLSNMDNNARLSFAEAALLPGALPPVTLSIRNLNAARTDQKIVLPTLNPNRVSLLLDAKVPGMFRGSFSLQDGRTASYTGLLLQRSGLHEARGHFLLPRQPQPGESLTTSEMLSGEVTLERAVP